MKTIVLCLSLVVAFGLTGCTTKSTARRQSREAFAAGQQQMRAQTQKREGVMFIGNVQNAIIPWTEDLTLASAIIAADYRGRRDPKAFILHRDGESATISARQLLQGEDFSLQAGDTVEIVP